MKRNLPIFEKVWPIKSQKLTDCNLHPVGFIVFSVSKKAQLLEDFDLG